MAQLKDTTITGNMAVSGTANITGGGQSNGNITLYTASGDSPALIFQRGTASDTLNDYKIYDTSGYLKIKQAGNSGTSGYTQVAELTNVGKLTVSTPPATDTTPSVSAWISPTDSAIKISGTAITPASGDYIPLSDSSNSNVVSRGIAIGTSTTTYLRNDGTWATPAGGGSGGDIYIVNVTMDDSTDGSSDKTSGEIYTAYASGKTPVCRMVTYTGEIWMLSLSYIAEEEDYDPHTGEPITYYITYFETTALNDPRIFSLQIYGYTAVLSTSGTLATTDDITTAIGNAIAASY